MTKSQRERAEKLAEDCSIYVSNVDDFIEGYAAGLADEDVRALVEALKFYAKARHFNDSEYKLNIENGGVARAALERFEKE